MAEERPIIFIKVGRPASANKSVPEKYKDAICQAYVDAGGRSYDGLLYGVVYYFVRGYNPAIHADADNISKPIWDALEGTAYRDDKSVRVRHAGIIDLSAEAGEISYESLDLTNLPASALAELSDCIGADTHHFLYIEVGKAQSSLITFNLSAGAIR